MKWFACMYLSLAAGLAVAGGQGTVAVGTNSTCVLAAPQNPRYISAEWAATNAYVNGQVVKLDGLPHLCVVAGTSSNVAPGVSFGPDISDGEVTWRQVDSVRKGLVLHNAGTNAVYFNFGGAATTAGVPLAAAAQVWLTGPDVPQASVHVIRSAGSGDVALVWW